MFPRQAKGVDIVVARDIVDALTADIPAEPESEHESAALSQEIYNVTFNGLARLSTLVAVRKQRR